MKPPKKKKQNRPAGHKRKRLTPNPYYIPAGSTLSLDFASDPQDEALSAMAADLLIRESVSRCSAQEKMLIAAMIPGFLKLIRGVLKPGLSSAPPPDEAPPSGEAK